MNELVYSFMSYKITKIVDTNGRNDSLFNKVLVNRGYCGNCS